VGTATSAFLLEMANKINNEIVKPLDTFMRAKENDRKKVRIPDTLSDVLIFRDSFPPIFMWIQYILDGRKYQKLVADTKAAAQKVVMKMLEIDTTKKRIYRDIKIWRYTAVMICRYGNMNRYVWLSVLVS
jgi:hypothetical protein